MFPSSFWKKICGTSGSITKLFLAFQQHQKLSFSLHLFCISGFTIILIPTSLTLCKIQHLSEFIGCHELPAHINNFLRLFVMLKSILGDFYIWRRAVFCSLCYSFQPSDSLDVCFSFFATQKYLIFVQLKMSRFLFHTH